MIVRKTPHRRSCLLKILVGTSVLALAIAAIGLAIIIFWPDVAAQNMFRLATLERWTLHALFQLQADCHRIGQVVCFR